MEERNTLFSMQKHARILPVVTCLVPPGPALRRPLLGPDLLYFDLPKNGITLIPFGYDLEISKRGEQAA